MVSRKHVSPSKVAHELVNHISNRLEILFNTVHTQLSNGLTKRTLLNDIDSIGVEINRYLNTHDKTRYDRLCKYHLRGKCWFGDSCWFRHETSVLSRPCTPQPKHVPKLPPRTLTPPSRLPSVLPQNMRSDTKSLTSTEPDVPFQRSCATIPYWRGKQLVAYRKKKRSCTRTKQPQKRPTRAAKTQHPPKFTTTRKSPSVPPKEPSPHISNIEHQEKKVMDKEDRKKKVWTKQQHVMHGTREEAKSSKFKQKTKRPLPHAKQHRKMSSLDSVQTTGKGSASNIIRKGRVGPQKLNQVIPPSLRGLRLSDLTFMN